MLKMSLFIYLSHQTGGVATVPCGVYDVAAAAALLKEPFFLKILKCVKKKAPV